MLGFGVLLVSVQLITAQIFSTKRYELKDIVKGGKVLEPDRNTRTSFPEIAKNVKDWYPILDCYTGLALTAISPDKGSSLVTKTITKPPLKNQLWMMDSEGTVYNYESGLVIDGAGSQPSMQPPLPITSSKQWMVRTDIRSVQETEPETVPKLVENGRLYGLNTGNRFLTHGSPVGMYNAKEVHPDNACWKTSFAEGKSGEELDMFKELLSKHKWTNSSSQEERKKRFLLWKTRKDEIDEHNKLYAENKTTYRMAENMFTIMSDSEFEARYKGLSMPKSFSNKKVHRQRRDTPETGRTKDWRVDGRVTRVQNQGLFGFQCGSCWAFSATGAIEAAYGRLYGSTDVVDLSESNLINCMDDEYTCEHGSNPLYAFKHVSEDGIATEDDVPYEAEKKRCQTSTPTNFQLTKIKSWVVVRTQTEAYLQETVETVGPVSVLICAKTYGFRGYKDGIFDEAACSNDCEESGGVDHAVLVVGYGEENNKPYWLVKNSWGTEWGEQGYIRMARNENNQCGIASYVTYPLLEGEAEAEAESVVCNQTTISEMFDVTEKYDIYCCDSDETKVCTGTECIDACRTVDTTEPCVVIVNHHHQPHCDGKPEGSTLVTLSRSLCKRAVACPGVGKQRGCSCCTKPYFKNTKCKQGCSNCATGAAHYGPLPEGEQPVTAAWVDGQCVNVHGSGLDLDLIGWDFVDAINPGPSTNVNSCIDHCKTSGFSYAGLRYRWCFCGNPTPTDSSFVPKEECNTACPGNSGQKCGRIVPERLNVYRTGVLICPDGWTFFQSYCYSMAKWSKWTSGRAACGSDGGDLVSIHSAIETDFLIGFVKKHISPSYRWGFWIGLNQRAGRGFVWSDGSSIDYTNWSQNWPQPGSGPSCQCECIIMEQDGTWKNTNCPKLYDSICKKKAVQK